MTDPDPLSATSPERAGRSDPLVEAPAPEADRLASLAPRVVLAAALAAGLALLIHPAIGPVAMATQMAIIGRSQPGWVGVIIGLIAIKLMLASAAMVALS